MRKISEWVENIRESEKRELSKLQQSYQDYFLAKLKKYGVDSPADLSAEKKAEFFNEITKDWEKGKGASEAGKKDVKEYGKVKESSILVTDKYSVKINEADVKNAEDFKEYAEKVLKKMHGDKYDSKIASKLIKDLSSEAEKSGDWGAAIGKLNKG